MQQTKKESELRIPKGKTAVGTGSTSGIGLGCARAFAAAGANIVLNGIGAPADVEFLCIKILYLKEFISPEGVCDWG
jgi:NAD(P)-dependent dehydrogenase (short-subunit alcohol dehydrogenase family)